MRLLALLIPFIALAGCAQQAATPPASNVVLIPNKYATHLQDIVLPVRHSSSRTCRLTAFRASCNCSLPNFEPVDVNADEKKEVAATLDTIKLMKSYPTGGRVKLVPILEDMDAGKKRVIVGAPIELEFAFRNVVNFSPETVALDAKSGGGRITVTFVKSGLRLRAKSMNNRYTVTTSAIDKLNHCLIVECNAASLSAIGAEQALQVEVLDEANSLIATYEIPVFPKQPSDLRFYPDVLIAGSDARQCKSHLTHTLSERVSIKELKMESGGSIEAWDFDEGSGTLNVTILPAHKGPKMMLVEASIDVNGVELDSRVPLYIIAQ